MNCTLVAVFKGSLHLLLHNQEGPFFFSFLFVPSPFQDVPSFTYRGHLTMGVLSNCLIHQSQTNCSKTSGLSGQQQLCPLSTSFPSLVAVSQQSRASQYPLEVSEHLQQKGCVGWSGGFEQQRQKNKTKKNTSYLSSKLFQFAADY